MIQMIQMIEIALILKIFFLLNPFASFPVLSAAYKKKLNVRKIAFQSVIFAFLIAIAFVLVGPLILQVFGIDIPAFRAAGGLVIILLGIGMTKEKEVKDVTKEDSMVSLIATPLLTGPATLSFLMLNVGTIGFVPLLSNVMVSFILTGSVFVIFALAISRIQTKYITFIGRLLGLFIIALGIEMLGLGVKEILSMTA